MPQLYDEVWNSLAMAVRSAKFVAYDWE